MANVQSGIAKRPSETHNGIIVPLTRHLAHKDREVVQVLSVFQKLYYYKLKSKIETSMKKSNH